MKFHLRKILLTSLLLVFVSLLLNGCAGQKRRYPPHRNVEPEREQTLRPEPEPQEKTIEEAPSLPIQEEINIPKLKPQRGPAHTLFHEAEQALEKGNTKRAEMLLERALRVEPKNGWYWHAMGRVQYAQGAYEQAIQFCLKSNSLAGRDSELKLDNQLLMKKASGKTGDTRSK